MADTPPPGVNLKADQGPRLVGSMITLIVLPTLFVIARLVSRKVARAGYWWDDLFVVFACALCYIQCICVLISERRNDFGKHIYVLKDPADNTVEFLKILYIYLIGYFSATSFVKFAILAFYRRIFPVQQLKLLLVAATGIVICYFLGSLLTAIFQCQPIHHFWDRAGSGKCANGDLVQIVPGAINCVIDFIIIMLPIPLLWRLRTTASQKGVLTGIFVCAGFVCIISIIRLIVLSRLADVDVTWNYVNSAIWSAAEPSMGVISACIPSLRPLVSLLTRGTTRGVGVSKTTKTSAQDASSGVSRMVWRSPRIGEDGRDGYFERLDDSTEAGNRPQWGHETNVRGGKVAGRGAEDEISLEEMNVPAGGIRVKDEVRITSSDWLEYKDKVF